MRYFLLVLILVVAGCAGGPTKDYYNPAIVGAKYKGPITMALVNDAVIERDRLVQAGYTVIGTTGYSGKYPEAKELIAQAKRVGANHVIYQATYVPNTPGSWSFSFGRGFGSGSGGGGRNDVYIIFLGK